MTPVLSRDGQKFSRYFGGFSRGSGVPKGGGGLGGVQTPHPRNSKIVPDSTRLWKLLKIAEFRTPAPQDVRKKGSKTLKLPPVRSCFTLAMTNKLVVIINSLKVPKIKKTLLYEMKFLVPNYSCLQNFWLGGYRPQISVLSVLNWIWTPPTPTKFLGTPLSRGIPNDVLRNCGWETPLRCDCNRKTIMTPRRPVTVSSAATLGQSRRFAAPSWTVPLACPQWHTTSGQRLAAISTPRCWCSWRRCTRALGER